MLVDYFYLVMVGCFSPRSKGQEPESPVGTEGTEWLKVGGRNKRGISPPSLVGCHGSGNRQRKKVVRPSAYAGFEQFPPE